MLVYSYAIHLRKGSYRSLPRTNSPSPSSYIALNGTPRGGVSHYPESILGDEDDEALADEFYRPASAASSHFSTRATKTPGTGSSIGSFADFVSAPGGGGRGNRRFRGNGSRPGSATIRNFDIGGKGHALDQEVVEEDEVLFDIDEPGKLAGSTTEESTSVSSRDERDDSTQRRDRHS